MQHTRIGIRRPNRSGVRHVLGTVHTLGGRGIAFRSLTEGFDTTEDGRWFLSCSHRITRRPPEAMKFPNQNCQTCLMNSPQGETGFSDTLSIRQLLKSISLRNRFLSADEG